MHKKILVASPSPAFGELIRLSLEESGKYRVRLVHTFEQAFQLAAESPFDLTILDFDLQPQELAAVMVQLQALRQPLRRIVIPPDNDPNHPGIAGLQAEAYLTKPFYIPDLLQSLEYLLEEPLPEWPVAAPPVTEPEPVPSSPLPKPSAVEQPLEELLNDVNSKAGVILHQKERWVSAGSLGEPAMVEITQLVNRAWNSTEPGDLVRYIRIAPAGECLLHARVLSGDLVLAMAFDATHPPTRIRALTAPYVQSLIETIEAAPVEDSSRSAHKAADSISLELPDDFDPDDDGEAPDFNLTELLATLPSPDPENAPSIPDAGDWVPENQLASQEKNADFVLPWEVNWADKSNGGDHKTSESSLEQTQPSNHKNAHLAETRPIGQGSIDEAVLSLADVLHYPAYTCLLLPARSNTYLTREIAAFLKEFVPRLFRAFGWQLEDLDVKPAHLQWSVRLPPAVSPGYLVRLLRKQTSKALFEEFKYLPPPKSGDFWAPGYLIINGLQSPSSAVISNFIAQTRRRQGLSQP